MKYTPLLFSGEMIRALGRDESPKTQTRRLVDRIAGLGRVTEFGKSECPGYDWTFRNRRMLWNDLRHDDLMARCPFGVPGDRIWAKETFCIETNYDTGSEYSPPFTDGRPVNWVDDEDFGGRYWQQCHYRATDPTPELDVGKDEPGVKWSPSIHMPRWASRITLELTDVRVQRAQEISEEDAIAEGVDLPIGILPSAKGATALYAYRCLWDSCSKPSFRYKDNPWLCALTFKRLEPRP